MAGIVGGQEREVLSSEAIIFTLDVSRVASSSGAVTNPGLRITRLKDAQNVTNSVTSGEMNVNGQVITLKKIQSLSANQRYRVEVSYDKESSHLTTVFEIVCPY